jgi:uncharacterized damage-inducible protein DinB
MLKNLPRRSLRLNRRIVLVSAFAVIALASARMQGQPAKTAAQIIGGQFTSVNQRVLDMVKDFPEDKYSYKPSPEVRAFPEVAVHVMSGVVYAAKAGRGEKASWDEIDPKGYRTKAQLVAAFEKSLTDATAALKALPPDRLAQAPDPWVSVLEHSAEHYGQIVVYYRANGLVPPASRPKKP